MDEVLISGRSIEKVEYLFEVNNNMPNMYSYNCTVIYRCSTCVVHGVVDGVAVGVGVSVGSYVGVRVGVCVGLDT